MFKTFASMTLVAGLLAGLAISATAATQDMDGASAECPTAKKVDALLASWEGCAKKSESATAAERAAMTQKVADVVEECPVGSRLGAALSSVRDALGVVVWLEESNAKHCPLDKADASSASCAEAKELKAARTQVLGKLHQLASYAAGPACCSEGGPECADAGCKEASSCPIRVASRVGAAKASLVQARAEAAALSPEARGEIMAGFATLSESCDAVALMPASVEALAEGFDVLGQLNTKMGEWAQANPEMFASVPESAHQAYMIEAALLEEARGLLTNVTDAMHTMQPTVGLAR